MKLHRTEHSSAATRTKNKKQATNKSTENQNENSVKRLDDTNWKFTQDTNNLPVGLVSDDKENKKVSVLNWNASQSSVHKKSITWYFYLFVITIVAAGLVFLLTKDKITTGVIVFAGLVFGYYGARKPANVDYQLDGSGIKIGQKFYDFNMFKSFSVISGKDSSSIILIPLKRFNPQLSVFYDPKDEKKIMGILSDRLPFEQRRDVIDSFLRWIHY